MFNLPAAKSYSLLVLKSLFVLASQQSTSRTLWLPFSQYYRSPGSLHMFVWIDSGHGIQLEQAPELWLLQDWISKFVGRIDPAALDLPVVCQVRVPPSQPYTWLSSGFQFGKILLNLL